MKKGFTLIELLVVVLIIGILAAIALPQYQKAVAKSRFAEALTNLKTMAQAEEVCFMGTGTPCRMDELPINIGTPFNWGAEAETEHFIYIPATVDVDGNPIWGRVINKEEDVCLCYLQTDEIVLTQGENGCSGDPKFNYANLLHIRNAPEACACC